MVGRQGVDAFQEACQREHQGRRSGNDSKSNLLEELEAKMKAGHSLSTEELEKNFEPYSIPKLEDKLNLLKKVIADGQVLRTGKVDLHVSVAEIEEELERRKTSKKWLAQAKRAQREDSPVENTGAKDRGNRQQFHGRHSSANKGRPAGSMGDKQVAAALHGNGKGPLAQRTPWTGSKTARVGSLQLHTPVTPMQKCEGCDSHVPITSRSAGAEPFLCHACIAIDDQASRSMKGKGRAADQEMETNAFADLEDYTDLTAAATAADEAGPSSLPLKENMQPATGRISANTRGQQPRPGLLDTRTIAEPSLKWQSGGCDPGSRLRSAAPKDGTEPASFYGSGRLASMQQAAPESTTGPQRRPSSRVQKRKAEQSNEPITLDDSDEEEATAEADQAQPGPRRTTRSTAYKGPADVFKGLKALYPEHGGPGSVEVVPADLVRLQPGEFLNDTIIDFYMRWIWQHLPEAVQKRCYFFNSFFYKKLSEKQPGLGPLTASGRCEAAKAAHERVRKWTKGVDIFEKDFLFLPIHDHLHWSLVIICHAGAPSEEDSCTPWILHLDSMTSGHYTLKIKKELLAYLTQEWDHKVSQGGESLPALWALGHPEAPQRGLEIGHKRLALPSQDNHCDCGLFLLTYTDYFTHSLPAAIRTKSRSRLEPPELEGLSAYPLFMQKHWFQPENAGALRAHIKTIILELFLAQVPVDQKETLADALAVARQEVEEYREDSQVPKYMSPADYESAGMEKRRSLERDRAEKAAKAAQQRLQTQERRRSGKGRMDIVVPRIPDSGDEGDALLRSGARRSGSAPPGSNASEDIEVCLEDDWRASETPLRQLRTAAERSPSVKAAAGMAEKLQKSLEDTWGLDSQPKAALDSRKRAAHVIDDVDDTNEPRTGSTPEPGQTASHEAALLDPQYAGRFRMKRSYSEDRSPIFKIADTMDSWASSGLGPAEDDWLSFPNKAAARAWMENVCAQDAARADMSMSAPMRHETFQDFTIVVPGTPSEAGPSLPAQAAASERSPAPAHGTGAAGDSRPPGLVDDGPEDLTADDGPQHQAEQVTPPKSKEGLLSKMWAGFGKLQGHSQPSHRTIDPCPKYLNSAAASASAESLAQASAWEEQLKHGTLASGTSAHEHTGGLPQHLRCQARTPSQGAQQHHICIQRLRGMLEPSHKEPVASTTPQKTFQRQGKKTGKHKFSADRPDIETSSEEAEGGECAAHRVEDSRIDLTSDCEAPAAQAGSGRAPATSPSRRTVASEAVANGNSCPPAQEGHSNKESPEVIADCSDKQPWQGHSKSKPEQTQTEAQVGGSLPAIDISQEPVSDSSDGSEYTPPKKKMWHKRKQHPPMYVDRPESAGFEKVQDELGLMALQPEQDGAASAAPAEGAPWRPRKRSASSSPLPPPRKSSPCAPRIRSDVRALNLPPLNFGPVVGWPAAQPSLHPIPISQFARQA